MARGARGERSSQAVRRTKRYKRELRSVGLRVRALRQERDWTLEEFSARSGVDWKHVQKIESGQINVSFVTILRIATGFDVPIAALFESD